MVKFLHGTNQTETSSRTSSKAKIVQRDRKNGWSCPWHPLQLIAWFFLCFFATTYFGIFVSYLPKEWRPAACVIPGGLYVIHLIVHVLALSIDPADPNIRSGPAREKNVFDRNLHAHVIENNHCHICEADVFSKSKHCSSCNKCVSDFDHHCKWLNTCVGGRNYKLFVGCISTAFAGSILMSIITLYLFIVFFTDKNTLLATQTGGQFKLFAPVSDTVFIVFVGVVESLHLTTIGLLGHLLCFHLYLIYMKISTYEFIVNSRERKQQTNNHEGRQSCEGTPINLKRFRNKVRPTLEGMENGELSVDMAQPEHSSSSEEPPCETTVKVMNEVSSKVAKRNSSLESPSHQNDIDNTVVYESVECPDIRTKQHPDTIPETVMSSSAESLREIPNADQVPGINVQHPSNMATPTSNQPTDVRNMEQNNQSNDAVVSHCSQSTGALYEQSVLESSTLQKDTKPSYLGVSPSDKNGQEEYSKEELSDSDGEELIPISTSVPSQEPSKNEMNVASNKISKKKKKKRKSELNRETLTKTSELNELPPLVARGRRPLPSLESYTNENSAS